MEENKRKVLEETGVDIEDALSRFMNNEALMLKMLLRFTEDQSFLRLKQAAEEQDADRAFEAAHTLKGLAGNLSLNKLYRQAGILTEDLRAGNLAEALEKMEALEEVYRHTIQMLDRLK